MQDETEDKGHAAPELNNPILNENAGEGGHGCPCDEDGEEDGMLALPAPEEGQVPVPDGEGPQKFVMVIHVPDEMMGSLDIGKLLQSLVGMGDMSDEHGMPEVADKIDSVMPTLAKVAQYEGFQNYWVANSRSFQKAWKEKMEKSKGKSAHDAWMEVLEEYQYSLLSNQSDFNEKYASSGGLAGVQARTAANMLMDAIANRLSSGSEGGVAVFEAFDDLRRENSRLKRQAVKAGLDAASSLYRTAAKRGRRDLVKKAFLGGLWDAMWAPLGGAFKKRLSQLGRFGQGVRELGSPSYTLYRKIRYKDWPTVASELQNQVEPALRTMRAAVDPKAVESITAGITQDLHALNNMVEQVVEIPQPVPDMKSKRYWPKGVVTGQSYSMYMKDLEQFIETIGASLASYERGKGQPKQAAGPSMDDVALVSKIDTLVKRLNSTLTDNENAPIPVQTVVAQVSPGGPYYQEIEAEAQGAHDNDALGQYSRAIADKIYKQMLPDINAVVAHQQQPGAKHKNQHIINSLVSGGLQKTLTDYVYAAMLAKYNYYRGVQPQQQKGNP